MSTDIVDLTTEARVQKAIEMMLEEGSTKKDACDAAGLSTKTFDRFLASSPDFVQRVSVVIRSGFTERLDAVKESRLKNLDAFLRFSERLRFDMESDDIETASAAFQALLKLEKQLAIATDMILPPVKSVEPTGPAKMGDEEALAILAGLSGAKLTKVTTIQVDRTEVIDSVATPVLPEPTPKS